MFFDTDPVWVEAVKAWTATDNQIARVRVFGSRATGQKRAKPDPAPIPDPDLAFALTARQGEAPGEPDAYWQFKIEGWRERLAQAIPVPVDFRWADPGTEGDVGQPCSITTC